MKFDFSYRKYSQSPSFYMWLRDNRSLKHKLALERILISILNHLFGRIGHLVYNSPLRCVSYLRVQSYRCGVSCQCNQMSCSGQLIRSSHCKKMFVQKHHRASELGRVSENRPIFGLTRDDNGKGITMINFVVCATSLS